ncbi:MAG: AraC family transcriptional regulator [Oscillospiraceae bacterium]
MRDTEPFDLKLAKQCARAFSAACGVGCVVSDAAGAVHYEAGHGCASCQICRAAGRAPDVCVQAHVYGMSESARFGGKYIYFCPMGLTCFTSPILGDDTVCAKLTVGPFLMVDHQDYIACDLTEQLHLSGERLDAVTAALDDVPYIPAERVSEMSNLLFMAAGFLNNVSDAERMLQIQSSDQIQGQVTACIQQLKLSDELTPYSFDTEQSLLRAVRQANREQAQKLLNNLLGHVLFSSGGELSVIKTRIYELLVLISRAAIEAGANPEQTLRDNQRYLTEINRITDFDALFLWLTRVMNSLMDSIFRFKGLRHANVIHQSVQYISTHYAERLTLEDMAQRVYLSPAYFSRVFKQEIGETFTAYLNRVRIDHSRALLRRKDLRLVDIALMVGFEDQSYFTKVFKKVVGTSPLRYREGKKK